MLHPVVVVVTVLPAPGAPGPWGVGSGSPPCPIGSDAQSALHFVAAQSATAFRSLFVAQLASAFAPARRHTKQSASAAQAETASQQLPVVHLAQASAPSAMPHLGASRHSPVQSEPQVDSSHEQ